MRKGLVIAMLALVAATGLACAGSTNAPSSEDGPRIGVHALLGQEDGRAAPQAESAPLATLRGSTLLAFVAGYRSNDSAPRDNHGNAWVPAGPSATYRGYDGRFIVRPWIAVERGGAAPLQVRIDKPGTPGGELTLSVVELRNAHLVDMAQRYPDAGLHLRSGEVHVRAPALLLAYWWGDSGELCHHVRPGVGFDVVDAFTRLPPNSAVQGVVAARRVEQAGAYTVDWYNLPAQGAPLWLFAFQAAGNSSSNAMPSTTR